MSAEIHPDPDPAIIEALERMLAEAKAGKLVGVALASVDRQDVRDVWTVCHVHKSLGPLAAACHHMWRSLSDASK